jgi:hypothetical protein
MLDSDFWHDLAEKFRALPDPDGILSAFWTSERGGPATWSVNPTKFSWDCSSLRAQFEALAARAGARIDNPYRRDLHAVWFDALCIYFPGDRSGSGGEVIAGKPSQTWGTIHNICEASATFCNILEYQALEAENLALREPETPVTEDYVHECDSRPESDVLSREQRLQTFVADNQTSIAAVSRAAKVYKANMQQWRHEELSDGSVMSKRIEDVLTGRTPLVNRGKKQR